MKANEVLAASGARLQLRTAEFDRRAREVFGGDISDAKVAERLGMDKVSLSLMRNGHRWASRRFVESACSALAAEPDDLFEVVEVAQGGAE